MGIPVGFPKPWQAWPRIGSQWPTYNIESPQKDDLVAWLPTLGSAGAGVLRDFSGYGNDGTLKAIGEPAWVMDGERGFVLDYDGADDYVTIGTKASLDNIFDGGGTLTAWIYPRSDGETNYGRIASKGFAVVGWTVMVREEAAGKVKLALAHMFNSGAVQAHWVTTNTEIPINSWSLVSFVYNADSINNDASIYVNGNSVGVTETVTPVGGRDSDAATNFIIANVQAYTKTFDGLIGEVKIQNRSLSPAEAYQLYANPWELHQIPRHLWAVRWVSAAANAMPMAMDHYRRLRTA